MIFLRLSSALSFDKLKASPTGCNSVSTLAKLETG